MSEKNGAAMVQHDVYLYFSMGGGMIERYYEQRLDDIGPTKMKAYLRTGKAKYPALCLIRDACTQL